MRVVILNLLVWAVVFGLGWWAGRYRLGMRQLPAITRALFGTQQCATRARELRDMVEESQAAKRPSDPRYYDPESLTSSHAFNELGEIARQADSVALWLDSARFIRPLGVPRWDKPESVLPFAAPDVRRKHTPANHPKDRNWIVDPMGRSLER